MDSTVYIVVDESVREAATNDATVVHVSVVRANDQVIVGVEDDGHPRRSQAVHLADRVGAMGGVMTMRDLDGAGNRLEAQLPCG